MILDIQSIGSVFLIAVLLIFILLAVGLKNSLYSIISLGVASVMLGVIFYVYDAPYAAVFEVSVCAGLITVLFVATINLTRDSES